MGCDAFSSQELNLDWTENYEIATVFFVVVWCVTVCVCLCMGALQGSSAAFQTFISVINGPDYKNTLSKKSLFLSRRDFSAREESFNKIQPLNTLVGQL